MNSSKADSTSLSRATAFLLPSFAPGGAERAVAWLVNELSQGECGKIVLITLDGGASMPFFPIHPSVELISFNLVGGSYLERGFELLRLRRFLKAHTRTLFSFVFGAHAVAGVVTLGLKVPLVVCERDYPRSPDLKGIKRLLRDFACFRAHTIVVQTKLFMPLFNESQQSKIIVIPNAVSQVERKNIAREKTIIGVGRLVKKKGFDVLIRAWSQCHRTAAGWSVKIYGSGPEEGTLRRLVARLGLQGSVEFCGVTTEIAPIFERAGIFVLPSRFEGFPNVLAEAMAHGLPVIAADAPGAMAELVSNRINGRLVAVENVDELGQVIQELTSDTAERERLGSAAAQVVDRFKPEVVRAVWFDLMRGLLNSTL